MTDEQGTVLERCRKLLAHAESAKAMGSTEEAETFAAKGSELLLRHKLEMSDVEMEAELSADVLVDDYFDVAKASELREGGGRRVKWLETILSSLCKTHFCEFLVIPGSKMYRIIGHESDRAIVVYMFTMLARSADQLGHLYYFAARKAAIKNGTALPANPKKAFLLGFAAAIYRRLKDQRTSIEKKGGQFALVRFAMAQQAVTTYMGTVKHGKAPSPSGSVKDIGGYEAGKKAGMAQSLHQGLKDAGPVKGTLAKGTQLLGGGK